MTDIRAHMSLEHYPWKGYPCRIIRASMKTTMDIQEKPQIFMQNRTTAR